jgi:uncharacterized protein (DUF305 family)
MKKLLLLAGFAGIISACNNDSDNKTASADTPAVTDHTATQESIPDTTGTSGKTMMSIMQTNMDQMKATTSSGNPDNDFAAMMKIHHMGAIEMAQLELAQGQNPELKAMAQKMLDAQQSEIAEFNTFLSGHTRHGGGDAFYKEIIASMNNMKMDMDHTGSIDKQFAEMMIPHHQGGIDMAKSYLKNGAHEEKMKAMANKIIADQQKEIGELKSWLAKNK